MKKKLKIYKPSFKNFITGYLGMNELARDKGVLDIVA